MSTRPDQAADPVGKVAVIAHRKKSLGGGLDELRKLVAEHAVGDLLWYEVSKSRKAGKRAKAALQEGADLVFVWGGDGMMQRCADALAGSDAVVAIVPAGTANLLATNLRIPQDLPEAVWIGFHGQRRKLDLGVVNGEHFAVMAGVGFDAAMIRDVGGGQKRRLGRLAYFRSGLRHVGDTATTMKITLDGTKWFRGKASCVLLGNVGTVTGGIRAFPDARPDDGWLEVGVTTARNPLQWARALGRLAMGRPDRSPLIRITRGREIDVRLAEPMAYELDGGARADTTRLAARVVPGAITVCVPPADGSSTSAGPATHRRRRRRRPGR
jgi:diacylglycerol kinase (ATP)